MNPTDHTAVKMKERASPNASIGWMAILSFALLSLLILAGKPSLLNLSFPAMALIVGAFLYVKYPFLYMGFSWWLWFLAPLIRRMADYSAGYTNPSPIILAPYLVTAISGAKMLEKVGRAQSGANIYFFASIAGTIYAIFVGFIKAAPVSAITNALEWMCPVLFGFFLYSQWREYPKLKIHTKQVFVWCVLITGVYGVIQYLILPGWDQLWLEKTIDLSENARAFGAPEPMNVRVWSTMNSPGVFAQVMMAPLLLLLGESSFLGSLASSFGYLSLLLSLVRSAWLGWLVGVAMLFTSLKSHLQIRLVIAIDVAAICALPLIFLDPYSEYISGRLQSLATPTGDGSANARLETYCRLLGLGLVNFLGNGFGAENGLLDSAILDILLTLGWLGSIFYVGGALPLLVRLLSDASMKGDSFASSVRAVCVGMIIQMPLGSVMLGLPGLILWGFLGIGLAGQQYKKVNAIEIGTIEE